MILSSLFVFETSQISAQIDSSARAKNLIFIEFFGTGGYGSLNYERRISIRPKLNMGLRAGLSTNRLRDFHNELNPDVIIPMSAGGQYGKKHIAEIALGPTFTSMVKANEYAEKYRENSIHTHLSLAYRYQKQSGGLFLRLAYTPRIEFDKEYKHWGGFSIGYAF